jgi:hypothetical protein
LAGDETGDASAAKMHHNRCNIRHDRLLSNEYSVGRNSALPGSRGCLDFLFFCHIPLTTFCLCYALGRTADSNPLRTPMHSAVHSLECPMFRSRATHARLRECSGPQGLLSGMMASRMWVRRSHILRATLLRSLRLEVCPFCLG